MCVCSVSPTHEDLPCSWRTVLQPIHLSFFVMKLAKPPTFDVTTVFTVVCSPSEMSRKAETLAVSQGVGVFCRWAYAEEWIPLWHRRESVRICAATVSISAVLDSISYRWERCYLTRRPDPRTNQRMKPRERRTRRGLPLLDRRPLGSSCPV